MHHLALLALLLIAAPAQAETATGNSGNSFPNFAGYSYLCNTDGCFQAAQRNRVPYLAYDSNGAVSGRQAYLWAGVEDASGGANLAQAGITFDSNGTGGFTYSAFWQCYPLNSVQTAFDAGATLSINAGDVVDSSVSCTNCTVGMAPPGTTSWTFTVNDVTKGQSVSKTGFACPMNNDAFYEAFWVIEVNDTSVINFGTIPFTNVTMNSANPTLTATLQTGCAMGFVPCARFDYATGAGHTGATINPSIPNGGNSFKICWGTGNDGTATGTGFTTCKNDPTLTNVAGGRGLGF